MSPSRGPRTRTLREGSASSAGMDAERLRAAGKLARGWADEGTVQTVEVLVARHGVIVLHEVFGRLTTDPSSPKTPRNALFPLASITKLFTATSLMTLVEEGRVGLNRPVSAYVPEFVGEHKDEVLVRHLLTHTSGLKDDELDRYALAPGRETPSVTPDPTLHPLVQRYYAARYGAPLWKQPGIEMAYADFNFELAGEIVRRVSGMALGEFGASRIFRPLGMKDTTYYRSEVPTGRRVRGPPFPGDPNALPDPLGDQVTAASETERVCLGAGFAYAPALDVAKFAQMFLNHGAYGRARILSPVTVGEMTRNQVPGISATFLDESFPEASWGLGWSVHGPKRSGGGLYSPEAFEHSGAGGTYLWVDPTYDLVGVYFAATERRLVWSEILKYWRADLFTDAVTAAIVTL